MTEPSNAPVPELFSDHPLKQELLDPDAVKIVHRLRKHGYESYLVGGCVRDLVLGIVPKDFDIATSATPKEIRGTFRNCRVIGRRFRLCHVFFKEKIIEVATFRTEPLAKLEEDAPEAAIRAQAAAPASPRPALLPPPESRGPREGREPRGPDGGRSPREARDGRETRESRDGRESREARDGRETRETRDGREPRGPDDARGPREPRGRFEPRASAPRIAPPPAPPPPPAAPAPVAASAPPPPVPVKAKAPVEVHYFSGPSSADADGFAAGIFDDAPPPPPPPPARQEATHIARDTVPTARDSAPLAQAVGSLAESLGTLTTVNPVPSHTPPPAPAAPAAPPLLEVAPPVTSEQDAPLFPPANAILPRALSPDKDERQAPSPLSPDLAPWEADEEASARERVAVTGRRARAMEEASEAIEADAVGERNERDERDERDDRLDRDDRDDRGERSEPGMRGERGDRERAPERPDGPDGRPDYGRRGREPRPGEDPGPRVRRRARWEKLLDEDPPQGYGTADEDARLRDFTINALFYDVEDDRIVDYVGGMRDLSDRLIRIIGDPEKRVIEDPVRILRGVKQAARLKLRIDGATWDAFVKHAKTLETCSPRRILEEVLKLLASGAAAECMRLVVRSGTLPWVLPELEPHLRSPDAQTYKMLAALDAMPKERLSPEVMVAALFYPAIREAWAAAGLGRPGDPEKEGAPRGGGRESEAEAIADEVMRPFSTRGSLSKKTRFDSQRIILAQRLLRRPRGRRMRAAKLVSRDWFDAAMTLLEVAVECEGADREVVDSWLSRADAVRAGLDEPAEGGAHGHDARPLTNEARTLTREPRPAYPPRSGGFGGREPRPVLSEASRGRGAEGPASGEPRPFSSEPRPSSSEPRPFSSEPRSSEPRGFSNEPRTFSNEPRPLSNEPRFSSEPRPVAGTYDDRGRAPEGRPPRDAERPLSTGGLRPIGPGAPRPPREGGTWGLEGASPAPARQDREQGFEGGAPAGDRPRESGFRDGDDPDRPRRRRRRGGRGRRRGGSGFADGSPEPGGSGGGFLLPGKSARIASPTSDADAILDGPSRQPAFVDSVDGYGRDDRGDRGAPLGELPSLPEPLDYDPLPEL